MPWEISTIKITSTPFQGGYADVAPWRFSEDPMQSQGPGRESMNDDLIYYLTERIQDLPNGLQSPEDATIYLRRIVASQYLHLIEYYEAVLSSQAFPLLRQKDFSNMQATSLEGQWSDKQLICSRLNRYIKDVAAILLELGVPLDNQQISHAEPSWVDSEKDFKYIHAQLLILKERADFLNGSLTALTGIIGNKRAIREAKTVKTLTLVAMLFIPLAFTAALLSMYDDFLPGKEKFWVFFAVSAPMVTTVFVVAFLFDLGYDANGDWDWGVHRHRFKKKVKMLH
jgi:hypothetical protein